MNFVEIILTAAKTVKISGAILVAICSHESGLQNIITPHDGGSPTFGICQVKYDTAAMLGYKGEPEGLLDPKTNSKYAALYLKYQYDRYEDWCMAIAAYNSGTYNPSSKEPGHPRNIRYVLNVGKKLNKRFQKAISCDRVSEETQYVAEDNGAGRRIQSAESKDDSNRSRRVRRKKCRVLRNPRHICEPDGTDHSRDHGPDGNKGSGRKERSNNH